MAKIAAVLGGVLAALLGLLGVWLRRRAQSRDAAELAAEARTAGALAARGEADARAHAAQAGAEAERAAVEGAKARASGGLVELLRRRNRGL